MGLETYRRKRDFGRTPEPRGRGRKQAPNGAGRFVVQQHAARRLHYDFRLELDGVLKSWAIPKGPSMVPGERRLAAQTEDHPLEYAGFEGVIPKGEYGGGTVQVWDAGTWQPTGDARAGLTDGDLSFSLDGSKLRGRFHLTRMRPRPSDRGKAVWLLIKGRDAEARATGTPDVTETARRSALTGREMGDIARDADRVWSSGQGEIHAAPPSAPRDLTGARRATLPSTIEPQLATLVDAAPEGDEWVHELKLDGYRLLCRRDGKTVRLFTRNGNDWSERFPTLADALRGLPAKSAVLDGEAVVLDAEGRSSFQALQGAFGERAPALHLFLFDVLYLDGFDVRAAPLLERKALLRRLLAAVPDDGVLRLSDHVVGQGAAVFAEACRRGVEGIVSKRADAPYRRGRSRDWLKVKCTKRQELVIAGFTDPAGSRSGFGALLLAARDADGTLRHVGKVGTGFDGATLVALRKRLEKLERSTPAVTGAPRGRGLHWVKPTLVAEVTFTEWTKDGLIRHPSFVALREDKPADDVRIEMAEHADTPPALRTEVAGVRLTHPERVYWPELGITKSELATYYERMAERVLPGLVQRPLSLVRCPEGRTGECFYQKRADRGVPKQVQHVVVKEGRAPYAMVTDLASLIALVQYGVLELHPWGARADRLDRPDIIVFDLDPDPSVAWRAVADAAKLLRALLDELGLVPFVRSTGGKGLHVVVPLERRASWEDVRSFAEGVAAQIEHAAPDGFTTSMAKKKRPGKIFLDVFRNAPEATAVASWSTRAREGAPVAATLRWDELDGERPVIGLRDAPARLASPDPWQDFEDSRRLLTAAMRRRVGASA